MNNPYVHRLAMQHEHDRVQPAEVAEFHRRWFRQEVVGDRKPTIRRSCNLVDLSRRYRTTPAAGEEAEQMHIGFFASADRSVLLRVANSMKSSAAQSRALGNADSIRFHAFF